MANKIIKKLSPCSAYDIAGTEQWLEEMAAQGYHLIPERGFFLGIGRFEVGEPRRVKYRLEAASARMALFEVLHWNTDVKPDEEALDIYEKMGWEYVTNRLAFHVYRSTREDAREFNTDPHMQAEGLKSAGIRLLLLLLCVISINISQVINAFLYTFSFGRGPYGGLLSAMQIILNVWIDLEIINRCVRFFIYCRKVKSGKNVRTERKRIRNTLFARLILMALLWLSVLALIVVNGLQAGEIKVEDYTDPVPFITLTEAYPNAVPVEEEIPRWFSNTVESGSTLLAAENLDWRESQLLLLPDGTEISANFHGEYHRARREGIAAYMIEKKMKEISELPYGNWKVESPAVGVDEIHLYSSEIGGPQLLLREGCHVIIASVGYSGIADDPEHLDVDMWVISMAEALLAYVGD